MKRTAIASPSHDDDNGIENLDELSIEEIAARFETVLKEIYLKVAEAAFLLLSLEKRPEAQEIVRKLRRRPIVEAVRNVGVGALIKEAFADYYSRPDVLRCLTALPIEKQREIVDAGSVPVFDNIGGKDTHRLIPVDELTPQELSLVFDTKEHRIRKPEEQAKLLASRRRREGFVTSEISHDPRTGFITAKNATFAEVQAYAKKHGLT